MKPLRLPLALLCLLVLPGCKGCQSANEPIVMVDGPEVGEGSTQGGQTRGELGLNSNSGDRARVTVESAEKFAAYLEDRSFKITESSGNQENAIAFRNEFGCLSASIFAAVHETANRYVVYRIRGFNEGKSVTFYVTDPAGRPCIGGATGRGTEDIPESVRAADPRSGSIDEVRSFGSYPLLFEWQVTETPQGKGKPAWRKGGDRRVALEGRAELRSDSAADQPQLSIDLCRPQLEALKAHGSLSYTVGVRLSPLLPLWPAESANVNFDYYCWGKDPILKADVDRLLSVVVDGELPFEPQPAAPAKQRSGSRKDN